jgi:hypothetical protein
VTIQTIRDGLKTRLQTIPGLRASDTIPEQINPPIAVVSVGTIDYSQSFGGSGLTAFNFVVTVFVSRPSTRTGQNLLDDYMEPSGSTSVKAALEAMPGLSGASQDVYVSGVNNVGSVTLEDSNTYLTADFAVLVYN